MGLVQLNIEFFDDSCYLRLRNELVCRDVEATIGFVKLPDRTQVQDVRSIRIIAFLYTDLTHIAFSYTKSRFEVFNGTSEFYFSVNLSPSTVTSL